MDGTANRSKQASPAVSVIVCTHNRARYLDECFRSVAAQDSPAPFEVVVVNNASTDDTAEVVGAWCKRDPRFRAAQESRLGQSVAKNTGVKLARGQLILFTDDDVILESTWIKAYCDFFSRHNNEWIVAGGRVVPVPHDLGEWPLWFDEQAVTDVGLLDYGEERSLGRWEYVWGNNMAVPKTMFERLGLWDETLGHRGEERGTFEDVEFQDRVNKEGVPVWFCPKAVIHHRINRGTITPRRIVGTSFSRGLSEFWKQSVRRWSSVDLAPRQNFLKCLIHLCASLSHWGMSTVGFAVFPSKRLFGSARHAAWSCGWWFGALGAGRNIDLEWSFRLTRGLAVKVQQRLLRITSAVG